MMYAWDLFGDVFCDDFVTSNAVVAHVCRHMSSCVAASLHYKCSLYAYHTQAVDVCVAACIVT
jgi:hypothetical protein